MLPVGRSTFPKNSEHFLPLCNGLRVFLVMETPLKKSLRTPSVLPQPSETFRQLIEIRKLLSVIALICLLLTTFVSFVRLDSVNGDLSLLLPLPLLSAIGILPVVGPAFLFITEILGTARILTIVHHLAAPRSGEDYVRRYFLNSRLLLRYIVATLLSRLSLWQFFLWSGDIIGTLFLIRLGKENMLPVPPVSQCLLEKLGVATCVSVVDDQIVCEPHAIPQQLIIPSARGLKLLDLCLTHDEDSDHDSDDSRSSSSDSSDNEAQFLSLRGGSVFRRLPGGKMRSKEAPANSTVAVEKSSIYEVQFEDPTWWQYLPSLKCIGLASLVVDGNKNEFVSSNRDGDCRFDRLSDARSKLVPFVCRERRSNQLRALGQCIGFSSEPNASGDRGDLSPYMEKLRLHILSKSMVNERLEIDAHERSSEQSRWWGYVRPDATSVIVQDSRSKAYQVLTIGDPSVVIELCHEAWQGEISTILPLAAGDRRTILETTNDWKLADLDVTAFAYSPIPRTLENRIDDVATEDRLYLFDGITDMSWAGKSKNPSDEWSLAKNQVFLGVLGSFVVPRGEIQRLLKAFAGAGVRFVYFSPRNMRRQKELAIQLSIDVSWNAAISLRPLESGEDEDPHRMTSAYADWDVNARLPHGVDDVKRHLEEVDNVPLLVSLFTDVTKQTTRDMIEVFQEYSDTVISVGSTMPWNEAIFSTADIAVGIDIFDEHCAHDNESEDGRAPIATGSEIEFASGISAHSCAFRFRNASSVSHLSDIMQQGRAALAATTAACIFLLNGCLAFSFFVLFCACSLSTVVPFVPALGSVLYLQIVLPIIGLALCMTDAEPNVMKHVPPKNDQSITFRRREGKILYTMLVIKAIPPALSSAIMWLIAYGALMLTHERELLLRECPNAEVWANVIRCEALKYYSGPARINAGDLALSHLVLCVIICSTSFVYRFHLIVDQLPICRNHVWALSVFISIGLTVLYLSLTVDSVSRATLPWYYYLFSVVNPLVCLVWNELCKRIEARTERRADKLRRLQFETRLGAYSPK
ncbi:hypothetical protein MPSEU_000898300 [Mayamaea pseudoterrestris]|nr:hypothetical protein MPSEU_000898300 [Mayamaea pseudoterrestris]